MEHNPFIVGTSRLFSALRSNCITQFNHWSRSDAPINDPHHHHHSSIITNSKNHGSQSPIQTFHHSHSLERTIMDHSRQRNYNTSCKLQESSGDPAQDFFDEMRRMYIHEEMVQNFYEFESQRGKSAHGRRLLWTFLAFPAVFALLVACTVGFDKMFHEEVQGNIQVLVQQALSQYIQSVEQQKKASKAKESKVPTPLLTKGPIINEPNDNAFNEIEKDVKRYPFLYAIIAANVAAHFVVKQLRWSAPFAQFYTRHMTCSVNNILRGRIHTLVTCTFIHGGLAHLGFNMYALYSMGHLLYEVLSPEAFLGFYLGAGACASVGSILLKLITKNYYQGSVGASGAVFAIMFAGLNIISLEKAKLNLIFLPDSLGGFDPKYFLPAYFIGEILFNVFSRRVKLDTGGT